MSVTIRQVMTDPALFGPIFGGESWAPWRALLAGFYGLPLDDAELTIWKALTGRESVPKEPHDELWLPVGRRGGKSQSAALLAVYESAFKDYSDRLSPGEVATVLVIAADRKQARAVFRYVLGLMRSNPMLERMIVREDKESIELSNRTVIEIGTASFRGVRGYTVAACIADEVAYWHSEYSANPDYEIINAIRPAMATIGGKLIALSSPYGRKGVLWDNYSRYYGKESPILVAQAASLAMNPTLPSRVVEQALERDPEAATAEYLAQFRSDLEQYISRDVVEDSMRSSPLELPYDKNHRYFGFSDPSGGGADEFCLSIGHMEGSRVVVDTVRARKGTPAVIVEEYAALLKSYGVLEVHGDRYGGSWPADEFRKFRIDYKQSAKPKSELYIDALPAFNSGRVELPPDDRLLSQLIGLERRTARSGRDSIDHPPGGHDDRANVVAGLIAHSAAGASIHPFHLKARWAR